MKKEVEQSLSIGTAALKLSVSTKTIRRLLSSGDLSGFKIGVSCRILESSLIEYQQRQIKAFIKAQENEFSWTGVD